MEKIIFSAKYDKKLAQKVSHLTKKEKELFIERCTEFSKKFMHDHYNLEFKVPIVVSGRLSSSLAFFQQCYINDHVLEPSCIKFSEKFLAGSRYETDEKQRLDSINDVLSHELVHYSLSLLNKGYSDGEYDFENELCKLGIASSGKTPKYLTCGNKKLLVSYGIEDEYNLPNGKRCLIHTQRAIFINREKLLVKKYINNKK